MKKLKLIIATVAVLGLATSSAVYADGFAPGEGLYIGAFVGHSGGHVAGKVVADAGSHEDGNTNVEIKDGGIGLSGIEGGGYIGYGYRMGDLYIGFEADGAGGGAKFDITSDRAIMVQNGADATPSTDETLSQITAETQWTAGGGARIGFYVNADTLLSVKGGIAASKFDVTYASVSESYWGGGPRLGAALESRISAIDPNLSVRISWDYTDYMTAPVHGIGSEIAAGDDRINSEVSGAMYNARMGFQYSFFDVNSLF